MNISGEATIFRNEHEGKNGAWYSYSTGVSSKRQDGSYINAYLPVRFRKNVVVENKSKIDIKEAFLTAREYTSNGQERKIIELMVLEFDMVDAEPTGFSALTEEDVPF